MFRSAVSKVMWVGRATVFLVGLAVILALVFGVVSRAVAHSNADTKLFHLGHLNSATTPTSLVSTLADAAKSALVVNNKSGGSALDLRVSSTEVAPMKVNSNKVVSKLNADMVDGKHAGAFLPRGGKAADSDKLDGKDSTEFANSTHAHSGADITSGTVAEPRIDGTVTRDGEVMPTVRANDGAGSGLDADQLDGFDASELLRGASATGIVNTSTSPKTATLLTASAPRQGGLLVNLSFSCASFSGTTDTRWDISLRIDGADAGNRGSVWFPHGALASTPGDSTSVTAFVPVEAGNHTIGYNASRHVGGDGSLDCAINVSSLFVPFANNGSAPT